MKLSKLKKSGLLVGLLFLCFTVVLAATALTYEQFQSKMEAKGYTVTKASGGYLMATPPGATDEAYGFYVYTSEETAKTALAVLCYNVENDIDDNYISYSTLNCGVDYTGETGMVKSVSEESTGNIYRIAYRVKDTIMIGAGYEYNQDQVNDVMDEFGYYGSSSFVVFIVLGVFIVIGAGIVILIIFLTKKKPNQPNNMYGYNPNMNNGQNMNYQQNPNMNYQLPNQNMNYNQNMGYNPNMQQMPQQPMNNNYYQNPNQNNQF